MTTYPLVDEVRALLADGDLEFAEAVIEGAWSALGNLQEQAGLKRTLGQLGGPQSDGPFIRHQVLPFAAPILLREMAAMRVADEQIGAAFEALVEAIGEATLLVEQHRAAEMGQPDQVEAEPEEDEPEVHGSPGSASTRGVRTAIRYLMKKTHDKSGKLPVPLRLKDRTAPSGSSSFLAPGIAKERGFSTDDESMYFALPAINDCFDDVPPIPWWDNDGERWATGRVLRS